MKIARLQLNHYRNYTEADITPCPGITVFCGDNAQGKTNLLEAVYLCCVGRSHRTSHDRELIAWNADIARVKLEAERVDGMHEIEIAIPQTGHKLIKVGGRQVSRSGELMGHINGVLFSPEDLRMVKDGPAERRRFIDMELSQIRPAYYYALQRYNRALKQRGRLLRDAQVKPALLDTIDAWDDQLALAGAEIITYRRAFIERLDETASEIHREISGGREALRLLYDTVQDCDLDVRALSESMRKRLFDARMEDLRRGSTSVGPHRDDLEMRLGGVDVRAFGSQGQQRTCALSMKLSELHVMRRETGEWPVLMLDDVMSELDPGRRRQLLNMLTDVQTLVTCTDPDDLSGAAVGALYRVADGHASL